MLQTIKYKYGVWNSTGLLCIYEGKSVSKLQIVIEKKRMGIMTYKNIYFSM